MILYFSATGNSKFLAEELSKRLGNDKLIDLGKRVKEGDLSDIEGEGSLVVVSPVHCWRLPRFLDEHLRKTKIEGFERVYFILSCGDNICAAGKYNRKLAEALDLSYSGTRECRMGENYIMLFDSSSREEALERAEASLDILDNLCEAIRKEEVFSEKKFSLKDKFLSGFVNNFFYRFIVKDKKFRVSEDCIGCGLCSKACPINNIRVDESGVVFLGKCVHCSSCINKCPGKAISYGEKSKKREQYDFSKILKGSKLDKN